jgi:hypothetical protein
MSFDIRRCSKEDLDRLNADAKAWRDRNDPATPDVAQNSTEIVVADTEPSEQLDLWREQ